MRSGTTSSIANAGPPSAPWAARRSSRGTFPDGVVGQEYKSCPRRIKRLSPKWCPVPFFAADAPAEEAHGPAAEAQGGLSARPVPARRPRDRSDEPGATRLGPVLRRRAREPVLLLRPELGGTEGAAAPDAGTESSGTRVEEGASAVALRDAGIGWRLPHPVPPSPGESAPHSIGRITLGVKRTGERRAGIRTLRLTWRGLETGLRRSLNGHEAGNGGYGQGSASGVPRQSSTLPTAGPDGNTRNWPRPVSLCFRLKRSTCRLRACP